MAVTTVPSVSYPKNTTKGSGVSPTSGVSKTSTITSSDMLLLLSTGQLLLMTGGNLIQVQ